MVAHTCVYGTILGHVEQLKYDKITYFILVIYSHMMFLPLYE